MLKLFNVYFPKRTVALLFVEAVLVCAALLGATFLHYGVQTPLMLSVKYGYFKVGFLAAICFFFLYCNDLYAPSSLRNSPAVLSRFIKGLGIACLVVAPIYYLVPSLQLVPSLCDHGDYPCRDIFGIQSSALLCGKQVHRVLRDGSDSR